MTSKPPAFITVAEALAGSHTNRLPCKPKPLRVTFIHCPTPRKLARPPSF